jgi:hypothetical protein
MRVKIATAECKFVVKSSGVPLNGQRELDAISYSAEILIKRVRLIPDWLP